MAVVFDLYDGDTKVKESVPSPIVIDGLTPDMEYSNYSVAYAGKPDKTPLSFKTKATVTVTDEGA